MGHVASDQENYSEAQSYSNQALTIEREIGSPGGIANCLSNLGSIAIEQNELGVARLYLREMLQIHYEIGVRAGVVGALEDIANLAQLSDQPLACWVQLASAASVFRKETGFGRSFTLQRWDARRLVLRAALGDTGHAAASLQGEALSWDEAVARALGFCDSSTSNSTNSA